MSRPIKTYADLHTHSLASQHAYSTLSELCSAAKSLQMTALALTDHGPGMPDGAIAHHFFCLTGLPAVLDGLHFYRGAEANIMAMQSAPQSLHRLPHRSILTITPAAPR